MTRQIKSLVLETGETKMQQVPASTSDASLFQYVQMINRLNASAHVYGVVYMLSDADLDKLSIALLKGETS